MNVYEVNQYEWTDDYYHISDSKLIETKKELEEISYHKSGKLYEIIKINNNDLQRKTGARKPKFSSGF